MNGKTEAVTMGVFREAMDNLASLVNKGFQAMEARMGALEFCMERIDSRAGMIESSMAKQKDLLLALTAHVDKIEKRLDMHNEEFKAIHKKFDIVFAELKEIRKQFNKVDTRAEVLDLQVRVTKLERKVEI